MTVRRKGYDDPQSQRAAELIRNGLGYEVVARRTGLTYHQVKNQAFRTGNKNLDFRRGGTPTAQHLIARVDAMLRSIRAAKKNLQHRRQHRLRLVG